MALNHTIKMLREQKGLTQQQLCERVGVSVLTIRNWESGAKSPSLNALRSLALTLGTSLDSLLDMPAVSPRIDFIMSKRERKLVEDYRLLDIHGQHAVDVICAAEKKRVEDMKKAPVESRSYTRFIPYFLTRSAAGFAFPSEDSAFDVIEVDSGLYPNADFAVSISGNSMLPYIHDGDVVFVHKTEELSNGDIGLFSVDGELLCKFYHVDKDNQVSLVSANPEFKNTNRYLSEESICAFRCFGKVLLNTRTDLPQYLDWTLNH